MDNRSKILSEATKWLLEIEALDNPQIKNALVLNLYEVSPSILDADILIDTKRKKMLVWLKLNWWGSKFRQKGVTKSTIEMLQDGLPSFSVRVIYDRTLFDKALEIAKKISVAPRLFYE